MQVKNGIQDFLHSTEIDELKTIEEFELKKIEEKKKLEQKKESIKRWSHSFAAEELEIVDDVSKLGDSYVISSEGGLSVAVPKKDEIPPELLAEGMAREIVRRLQEMRSRLPAPEPKSASKAARISVPSSFRPIRSRNRSASAEPFTMSIRSRLAVK